ARRLREKGDSRAYPPRRLSVQTKRADLERELDTLDACCMRLGSLLNNDAHLNTTEQWEAVKERHRRVLLPAVLSILEAAGMLTPEQKRQHAQAEREKAHVDKARAEWEEFCASLDSRP